MTRLRPISKKPEQAAGIAPEVKLTYIVDVIEISLPLIQNKNPTNPSS